jgi:mRNA interferase MazF
MKRGEIWTLQDDGYASKARPVIIVQAAPMKKTA